MLDPFSIALQQLKRGNLSEAKNVLQQLLTDQPNHADAWHVLGIIARRGGDNRSAIEFMQRALQIKPDCADANYNLANALRDAGRLDEAVAAYQRAIGLRQNLQQAYHNMGCVLRDQGLAEKANAAFTESSRIGALEWFGKANRSAAARLFDEAIAGYEKAIALQPDLAEAHCNLGNALVETKQLDFAIAAFKRAIAINPKLPEAHLNLAKALYDQGQLDEAMTANRQSIALRPSYAAAHRNLASNLFEAGLLDEAIDTLRHCPRPTAAVAAAIDSELIYMLHFRPDSDAQRIAEKLMDWDRQHAQPLARYQHPTRRDQIRRLRIGYVSPDFRQHVVGFNLQPLFEHHDHEQFDIFCYSDVVAPDTITRWFEKRADHWVESHRLSDAQLAEQIRLDRIDLLVDLALHTRENRLRVFAEKPAPVQVSFAGYPGSTGVSAIHYRLSDPYLDPQPNVGDVVHLPHSFWCYQPNEEVPVNPLPAGDAGIITFGCLNNFCKINPPVLDLWARVMKQVEGSRLLLLARQGSHRGRTIDYLQQQGVDSDRVEFVSYAPRREYLLQYHRIDIGLDTFPYNGHTTSLDSLWMGVPVVTLCGELPVSRAGWSQLSNLNLSELVTRSADEFVTIASSLAADRNKLRQLRTELRPRMQQSPLMDAPGFARGVENAYRKLIRRNGPVAWASRP